MKKIKHVIDVIITISALILAIYFIYTIDRKDKKDVVKTENKEVVKNVPDNLIKMNNMVYFKGKTVEKGFKIWDRYQYNPNYPREFLDGYLSLAMFNSGTNYFIWTEFETEVGINLDGWFMAVNGVWHNRGDEYIIVLIPVVEREKKYLFDD